MKRTILLLAGTILSGALIVTSVACSSSDSPGPSSSAGDAAGDAVDELVPVEPADAAVAACKLGAKMTTGVAICDECLQKGCCQVLVACLGEKVCGALSDCLNDCRARLGTNDAGAQCAAACVQGKDEPAKRLTDALECESTRCGTQCK
ncbi:hypothetical protein BH11MYX4_BH11MYX4_68710 [soil metagenome]